MKGLERAYSSVPSFKQQGAALIIMMFIIGLAAVALLIKSYNADSLRVQQEEKTMLALGQAKEALIAWSVSYRDLPGLMPYPNRGTDAAGYEDGGSDCFAAVTSFNYQFLLGMLPSRDSNDTNCITLSRKGISDFRDAGGNPLWYAVSRNLVRNYEAPAANPVINPGMVNVDVVKPTPYDGTEVSSPYPWLVVRDMNGNVVSDRVAVVIVAPGPPLPGQNRTNTATSAHFLDQITVGVMTYSNRDYDQPDEDFVMGGDSTLSNTFNDRLVYITIDELMAALTKRAAAEARVLLNEYRFEVGRFPYAAALGGNTYESMQPGKEGLLPLKVTDTCDVDSSTKAICDFNLVSQMSYEAQEVFDSEKDEGICESTGEICTCTGLASGNPSESSCETEAGKKFKCDDFGECEYSEEDEEGKFKFFVKSFLEIDDEGSCLKTGNTLNCTNPGTFKVGLKEPGWFWDNKWHEYLYYRWSGGSDLQVGSVTGVSAIIIGTGAPITTEPYAFKGGPQERPPSPLASNPVIQDYLDSEENINGDLVYEPVNKRITSNYNDQTFIVAP